MTAEDDFFQIRDEDEKNIEIFSLSINCASLLSYMIGSNRK